eukprot:TRINITY_DN5796_c0_g1_i1.p1 TRINITY_DN5796_c0_g1~~TRINITY_DN5796_c0_g1_i1.p1  ORF type:complete len:575 (+),score=143.66 TRINITY_DN5796_c0_g1_i1:49-1773(+)
MAMAAAVTVRGFRGGRDLEGVHAAWNAALCAADTISAGRLAAWLLGDANFDADGMLLAVAGEEVVGFVRAVVRRTPNENLGLETDLGFMPVMAVVPAWQRRGVGTQLWRAAVAYFRREGRSLVWVSGKTGSAPGYVFPGVDVDAYAGAAAFLTKMGCTVHHRPVSMLGLLAQMDLGRQLAAARADERCEVVELSAGLCVGFFKFMRAQFPGDWITAARAKIQAGRFSEVLVAIDQGEVVGYCQWEGEHFGPFGVAETHRNKGLGSRLFLEAASRISQAEGRTVWFNWADEAAARFYGRHGLKSFRNFAIMTLDLQQHKEPSSAVVPAVLPPEQRLHVLVIGAHIGDAEISGGLVATKYARAGHRVTMLHMTAGEKGNPKMDDQVYRKQRIQEAQAAASIMGAEQCIVLDYKDGELQAEQATYDVLCAKIRELKPDVILTHWRGSFHRDHRATYQSVMEGAFLAALPGIKTSGQPAHLVRGLYYLENWEDLEDYQPDLWLPLDDDTMAQWVRACEAHQLLRGEVSFPYLQYYRGLAAKRGAEVSAKYAVTVSLPPISRKRRVEMLPVKEEPVLIF